MVNELKSVLDVAAKALIMDKRGRVLIVREAKTDEHNTKVGFWGIVGGRLNQGESFFDGLDREVFEETGLKVKPIKPLYIGEWQPTIKGTVHRIVAIFMQCSTTATKVKLSPEHDQYAWVDPSKRHDYPMMEPDCFAVDLLANN